MRCPNCLGTGKVPQVLGEKRKDKVVDIHGEQPKVRCLLCMGTGERPEWMNDERGNGHVWGEE
jgi:NAD-dependent SIR2 family protein deacetylase